MSGARLGTGPSKHPSETASVMAGQHCFVRGREVYFVCCTDITIADLCRPCVMIRRRSEPCFTSPILIEGLVFLEVLTGDFMRVAIEHE